MRLRSSDRLWRSGWTALVSGAAFALLTALYRSGATRDLDRELLLRLRELHAGWLDALGTADDVLFRPTLSLAAALVMVLFLWRFGPPWSWCAPPFIGLAAIAEVVMKNGWSQVLHPRALLDAVQVLFGGQLHISASFPSGHVTHAIFLAVIAWAFLPRKVSVPFLILALTTPFARMYVEAHRLSDVLGGVALGTCVASLAVWSVTVAARLRPKKHVGGPPYPPESQLR